MYITEIHQLFRLATSSPFSHDTTPHDTSALLTTPPQHFSRCICNKALEFHARWSSRNGVSTSDSSRERTCSCFRWPRNSRARQRERHVSSPRVVLQSYLRVYLRVMFQNSPRGCLRVNVPELSQGYLWVPVAEFSQGISLGPCRSGSEREREREREREGERERERI